MHRIILLVLATLFVTPALRMEAQRYLPGSQTHYQVIFEKTSESYKETNLLRNGVYFDDPYIGARGNPYLYEDSFMPGTVVFRNKLFTGILLKYDIVDQRIVVDHQHDEYRLVTILTDEFVTSFTIGENDFRKITLPGEELRIYQVIFEGDQIGCYHRWHKSRSVSHHLENRISFSFSKSLRRSYLTINGNTIRFRTTRSFLRALPEGPRSDLKAFLKARGYNIKRVNDKQLRDICEFADQRMREEGA